MPKFATTLTASETVAEDAIHTDEFIGY